MARSRVAVIGTGYVGLATAVVLAEHGIDVTCADKRPDIRDAILRKECPIHEPGLPAALRNVTLTATTNAADAAAEADVIFLCVGTPPQAGSDRADLSFLENAAREIGAAIKGGARYPVVVVKSTVPPGTTDTTVRRILEASSGRVLGDEDADFGLAMVPEFLREGSALQDTRHPGRIVLGVENPRAAAELSRLFEPFGVPLVVTNARTAELAKYMCNALLATLISFGNDFSNLAAILGNVDMRDAIDVLARDPRWTAGAGSDGGRPEILSYLTPGPGFGGSCFPKDLRAILFTAAADNYALSISREALRVNEAQGDAIVRRLEMAFPEGLCGKLFGVYGLAFKAGTDDVRESPAQRVIAALSRRGARARVYDPVATANFQAAYPPSAGIEYGTDGRDLFAQTDGVIVITPWVESLPIFYDRDTYRSARRALVYDTRGALDDARMRAMPCVYLSPMRAFTGT